MRLGKRCTRLVGKPAVVPTALEDRVSRAWDLCRLARALVRVIACYLREGEGWRICMMLLEDT